MAKNKWIIFLIGILGIASAVHLCLPKILQKNPLANIKDNAHHAKYKLGAYFFPVEINRFNSGGIPSLTTQIENQIFLVKFDLGCSDCIYLAPNTLNKIEDKTFQKMKKYYGFRGKEYERKVYDIPKAQIGNITFWHPPVSEESEAFQRDSIILKGGVEPPLPEEGRVGWKLFENTNLLLDLKNSKIAFCDSVETLKKEGYPTESFIRTPLLFMHNMLQIETKTPKGRMYCWLDTGASWNMLNIETNDTMTLEQLAWEVDKSVSIPVLEISGHIFGPFQFHQIPIQLPFQVQAILGMEFFNEHLVFLDFDENYAYIAKRL